LPNNDPTAQIIDFAAQKFRVILAEMVSNILSNHENVKIQITVPLTPRAPKAAMRPLLSWDG